MAARGRVLVVLVAVLVLAVAVEPSSGRPVCTCPCPVPVRLVGAGLATARPAATTTFTPHSSRRTTAQSHWSRRTILPRTSHHSYTANVVHTHACIGLKTRRWCALECGDPLVSCKCRGWSRVSP